jgi:acetoin utilization deacetylase AcuC-like enzyme
MKVYFHPEFYQVYTDDPAADPGRMEAVMQVIKPEVDIVTPEAATESDIALAHSIQHIEYVKKQGLYNISALAAGAAIQTAITSLQEPCFGLIRPPGHHASANSCWGFCYFNNMAISIETLKRDKLIQSAYILDIDLHYGDGTENIMGSKKYVTVHNLETNDRDIFMKEIAHSMSVCKADIIGISAGFDNHLEDWGGVLLTSDYLEIGRMVKDAAESNNGACFGLLEGGYNHDVLGQNVLALIQGLSGRG